MTSYTSTTAFSHRFYSISNDASLTMLVAKAKELCERLNI
jgi:hypothetical protein